MRLNVRSNIAYPVVGTITTRAASITCRPRNKWLCGAGPSRSGRRLLGRYPSRSRPHTGPPRTDTEGTRRMRYRGFWFAARERKLLEYFRWTVTGRVGADVDIQGALDRIRRTGVA